MESSDPEEIVIFSRLSIILIDFLNSKMRKVLPYYVVDTSPILHENNFSSRLQKTRVSREKSVSSIRRSLRIEIMDFSVNDNWKKIKQHFEVFGQEELWRMQAVDNYQSIGILASNRFVDKLANRSRLEKIVEKVDVFVSLKPADYF